MIAISQQWSALDINSSCESEYEEISSDTTGGKKELQMHFRLCGEKEGGRKMKKTGKHALQLGQKRDEGKGRRARGVICHFGKTVICVTNGALCVLLSMCSTDLVLISIPYLLSFNLSIASLIMCVSRTHSGHRCGHMHVQQFRKH